MYIYAYISTNIFIYLYSGIFVFIIYITYIYHSQKRTVAETPKTGYYTSQIKTGIPVDGKLLFFTFGICTEKIIHICMHIYIYIYVYIYIYIYIHIYIYTP
jgi:hypothetical protein